MIGIDDWAMKKGQQYGSIVCDLQTRKPIALLTNRTVQEVANWLQKYPSIQIVTRDGSAEFAKGIREGRPNAIQITDRWHLFHNLSRKVEQYLKKLFPRKICISFTKAHPEKHVLSIQNNSTLTVGEKRSGNSLNTYKHDIKRVVRKLI